MKSLSLPEFADRINEIMHVIMSEFIKKETSAFYKVKITLPQFVILELLSRAGESKMSEMAKSMNVTTPAMTGIVDRLVREGHVKRIHDPDDRRIVRIRLTQRGDRAVKDITHKRQQMIIEMFGKITQDEREKYLDILMHIKEHLK